MNDEDGFKNQRTAGGKLAVRIADAANFNVGQMLKWAKLLIETGCVEPTFKGDKS